MSNISLHSALPGLGDTEVINNQMDYRNTDAKIDDVIDVDVSIGLKTATH